MQEKLRSSAGNSERNLRDLRRDQHDFVDVVLLLLQMYGLVQSVAMTQSEGRNMDKLHTSLNKREASDEVPTL